MFLKYFKSIVLKYYYKISHLQDIFMFQGHSRNVCGTFHNIYATLLIFQPYIYEMFPKCCIGVDSFFFHGITIFGTEINYLRNSTIINPTYFKTTEVCNTIVQVYLHLTKFNFLMYLT